MTPAIARTVEALALSCCVAIDRHHEWHGSRREYRLARAERWMFQHLACKQVPAVCQPHDPVRARAEALAIATHRRALAWHALAHLNADDALNHHRQALKARQLCAGIKPSIWGARA